MLVRSASIRSGYWRPPRRPWSGPGLFSLVVATISCAIGGLACDRAGDRVSAERPSILLFVMDTTRMDAVSAYGYVSGTTPVLDRLADSGVIYRNAFSAAPWTLPSHASLFTGLLPSEHGVGPEHPRVNDSLVTIAERLQAEGYETLGVSENVWVSKTFNFDQGFDHFATPRSGNAVLELQQMWRKRDPSKPYFLFINVIDSHANYTLREINRFLPPGVTTRQARRTDQRVQAYMCNPNVPRRNLEILRGLYHGDVAAADEKLGQTLAVVEAEAELRPAVQIVTSDHGEHFGESRLVSHQFSIRTPLLHVPLVVNGLPGGRDSVGQAVHLGDIVPSILSWVEASPDPALRGRVLPSSGSDAAKRVLVSEYFDLANGIHGAQNKIAREMLQAGMNFLRRCGPEDRVRGDMKSAIVYPYKINLYSTGEHELYDLSIDRAEAHDLSESAPARLRELEASLTKLDHGQPADRTGSSMPGRSSPEIPQEVLDQLRTLGYVD